MAKLTMFKRYANGEVKGLKITDTDSNVKTLLKAGFFLTEKEAASGKIEKPKAEEPKAEEPKPSPTINRRRRRGKNVGA